MLMFAYGFNIRFGGIVLSKNVDVTMIVSKAPGNRVREDFQEGSRVFGFGRGLSGYDGHCQRCSRFPTAVELIAFASAPSKRLSRKRQ